MSFTEGRLLSGHCGIKPRSVECLSDVCPCGSFSHLHTGSLELSQSDYRYLGHLSYQGPSPPIAQFGRLEASSRKSAGCSKLLLFWNSGGHSALGNLQCSRISFVAFPRSVPRHNPVFELCRQFLRPHGLVFALICIVSCETLYRQVCAFPNHVQSIEFTTGGLQSRCRQHLKDLSREMGGT